MGDTCIVSIIIPVYVFQFLVMVSFNNSSCNADL